MEQLTFTLQQLKNAHAAGKIATASLIGDGPDFLIFVQTPTGQEGQLILTRTSAPRRFPDPRRALELLRKIGILVGSFDARSWEPDSRLKTERPDSSTNLKQVHAKAAFVAELEASVRAADADALPDKPHNDVMARLDAELEKITQSSTK